MELRKQLLLVWLKKLFPKNHDELNLSLVSGDASFRKYYRVKLDRENFIAVDAPPLQEDSRKFVHVCNLLRHASVKAPKVFSSNYEQGFMLLDDFGNETYFKVLESFRAEKNVDGINVLYETAINTLLNIQAQVNKETLGSYSRSELGIEMSLFEDWFCSEFLELELDDVSRKIIANTKVFLEDAALVQLQVPVLRDYHSRNLMVLDPKIFGSEMIPGVIDFQDAVIGPYTYDLVSLLRDAYICWDAQQVEKWALYYFKRAGTANLIENVTQAQFLRDFDLMGLQRHLKIMGIFARLAIRDNKPNYLADIPLVIRYFLEVSQRYAELKPFIDWFNQTVMSVARTKMDLT